MIAEAAAGRRARFAAVLAGLLAASCALRPPPGASLPGDPLEIDLVLVAGGTYRRGSDEPHAPAGERPGHPVTVSDFRISRHEVTVAQFRRFVEATGYRTQSERVGAAVDADPSMMTWKRLPGISWRAPGYPAGDDDPVTWVSWNDASAFAAWLAAASGRPFRLPREAEWEFAARERGADLRWAGTRDRASLGAYAWHDATSGGRPHPVGRLRPNALGLYDLSGNVWEWCADGFAAYAASDEPLVDPSGDPDSPFRTLRGGSWRVGPEVATTTYRNGYRPDYAHSSIGFRVVVPAGTGGR